MTMTADDTTDGDVTSWRDLAACRGHDTSIFFPDQGESTVQARAICADCPVKRPCLDESVSNEELGVWGGQTARARLGARSYRPKAPRPPTCYERTVAELSATDQWVTANELAARMNTPANSVRVALVTLHDQGLVENSKPWWRWVR